MLSGLRTAVCQCAPALRILARPLADHARDPLLGILNRAEGEQQSSAEHTATKRARVARPAAAAKATAASESTVVRWEKSGQFIVGKLREFGFIDYRGEPVARIGWTSVEDFVIVGSYNKMLRDCREICVGDDPSGRQMKHLEYLLYTSCVKTLSHRHRLGHRKNVYAKYGTDLAVRVPERVVRELTRSGGSDAATPQSWFVQFHRARFFAGRTALLEAARDQRAQAKALESVRPPR
eukprot:Amastigsp_a176394_16.p2 type:complete len:237 gc:universal Amastigsp_a176394_16:96-806(+)